MSDSFTSGLSYGRSVSADVSSSPLAKEPLRKAASSDTRHLESDPVWKRAGKPVSRKTSGEQLSADSAKGKPFTRQLSKGVSFYSSVASFPFTQSLLDLRGDHMSAV